MCKHLYVYALVMYETDSMGGRGEFTNEQKEKEDVNVVRCPNQTTLFYPYIFLQLNPG